MSKHYTPEELVEGFAGLHTLPEVYFRIKAVVDDPCSQVSDLVRELGADPALTARVLRVVNSPLYRMGGKVETLLRAVNVLGTRAIHDLVLATSVTGMITRRALGALDMRVHWRTSLAIGMLARGLGESVRLVDRDRLLVEGLLSRMGEVVMYERIGAVAAVVARHAAAKRLPLQAVQRSFLGCHHGDVGAALLRTWRLPETICGALAGHLEPLTPGEPADVSLLRLAAMLAPAIDDTALITGLQAELIPHAPAGVQLDTHSIGELLQAVRVDLEALQQAFVPAMTDARSA